MDPPVPRVRAGELADPLGDVLADVGDGLVVSCPGCSPEVMTAVTNPPESSSVCPITAALATFSYDTIADSISAVDMRWLATLSTSSASPVAQQ